MNPVSNAFFLNLLINVISFEEITHNICSQIIHVKLTLTLNMTTCSHNPVDDSCHVKILFTSLKMKKPPWRAVFQRFSRVGALLNRGNWLVEERSHQNLFFQFSLNRCISSRQTPLNQLPVAAASGDKSCLAGLDSRR